MGKVRDLSHTRSRTSRKPARSNPHLDLVRSQQCLITRQYGCVAHHARECFPDHKRAGQRVNDFLCVPLISSMHEGTIEAFHTVNNASWWSDRGVDPVRWLRWFLRRHYPDTPEGVAEALKLIDQVMARNAGTV